MANKITPDSAPETSPKKDAQFYAKVKSDYRWKVFGQSAFITLSSIFVLGGLGWMLDKWIRGEGHLFFIIMLVISYPVTQFALYNRMKNFNPLKK